ncbi:hypothetical protein CCHR01_08331 [Colletotrichum chrysophilum]|uniref:Uncharacterized protein n=1 Tax=Colletotrichum chrysophilum TaxID=1836956 RepID=A0AAD9AKI2_9PEZI|nr:hypothetical protein CCHR01_08331 [Colletotrichum chrysophilum]
MRDVLISPPVPPFPLSSSSVGLLQTAPRRRRMSRDRSLAGLLLKPSRDTPHFDRDGVGGSFASALGRLRADLQEPPLNSEFRVLPGSLPRPQRHPVPSNSSNSSNSFAQRMRDTFHASYL